MSLDISGIDIWTTYKDTTIKRINTESLLIINYILLF